MLINEKVIKKIQKIRVFFTHPICQLLSYCPAASQRHRKLDFLATHFFLVAKLFQSKIFKGAWQFFFTWRVPAQFFCTLRDFFLATFVICEWGGGGSKFAAFWIRIRSDFYFLTLDSGLLFLKIVCSGLNYFQ